MFQTCRLWPELRGYRMPLTSVSGELFRHRKRVNLAGAAFGDPDGIARRFDPGRRVESFMITATLALSPFTVMTEILPLPFSATIDDQRWEIRLRHAAKGVIGERRLVAIRVGDAGEVVLGVIGVVRDVARRIRDDQRRARSRLDFSEGVGQNLGKE